MNMSAVCKTDTCTGNASKPSRRGSLTLSDVSVSASLVASLQRLGKGPETTRRSEGMGHNARAELLSNAIQEMLLMDEENPLLESSKGRNLTNIPPPITISRFSGAEAIF